MKRNLKHLTGTVILAVILIAIGFQTSIAQDNSDRIKKVTIYLKAYEEDGKMKLKMYDSKNLTPVEAKFHEAEVDPKTKVVWRRADDSGITSIKKVALKKDNGLIFPGDATTILLSKRRRIRVKADAPVPSGDERGHKEEYEIVFKDKKFNQEWPTDPYLRIRDR